MTQAKKMPEIRYGDREAKWQLDTCQRRIQDLQAEKLRYENIADTLAERDAEISYLKGLVQEQANTIDAIHGQAAWRLAQPLRWLGLLFRRILPNRRRQGDSDFPSAKKVTFSLRAEHDLDRDVSLNAHWRSTGVDPYFSMKPRRWRRLRGWCMIELMITGALPHALARFYFDFGQGYSEDGSLAISYRNGQMTKRLFYFEAPPRHLRFDPLECRGVFRVDHLDFVKVPRWFALSRMVQKLKAAHIDFMGGNESEIRTALKQKAKADGKSVDGTAYLLYAQCFHDISCGVSYKHWIDTVETPIFSDSNSIRETMADLATRPLISVIVPVYNTPAPFLRRCIESVIHQSHGNWELCIADDASTDPSVRKILEAYEQADERVNVVFRNENGHISAASNSALKLATGDFVALLDHDDELAEHAFYFVVKAINDNPHAKIIYSDEDKIDADGHRSDPHFKSDWNPALLLSQNYISHLGVYHRKLIDAVGGFREGLEGSQDYDLLLRCVAKTEDEDEAIVHIPHVLYHWRVVEGSTALAAGEKEYTTDIGIKALAHFIQLTKIDARVKRGPVPNTYRMVHSVSDPAPLVSLLIPTRDEYAILSRCISSILNKTTYPNYEILVLDNQSRDSRTLDYLKSIQDEKRIRVVQYNHPFNFSAINNFGASQARGRVLGLLNNDVEVISPGWLTEMVSHAMRPKTGCVGAKLYYPDGRIQHAGVILGIGGVAGHSHKYFQKSSPGYFSRLFLTQNLSAVTGACLLVRRKVFDQVNGLDEENLAIAFNDVDFCLEVQQAGYRNLWTPYAELIHHESISRGGEDSTEKVERFNREIGYMKTKWNTVLTADPYYSPHLSLEKEDFSIG